MSKMGIELDKRLDENKYEMWEALRLLDGYYLLAELREPIDKVLAKIEGKDVNTNQ